MNAFIGSYHMSTSKIRMSSTTPLRWSTTITNNNVTLRREKSFIVYLSSLYGYIDVWQYLDMKPFQSGTFFSFSTSWVKARRRSEVQGHKQQGGVEVRSINDCIVIMLKFIVHITRGRSIFYIIQDNIQAHWKEIYSMLSKFCERNKWEGVVAL